METLNLNLRIAYVDFSGLYRLNDLQGLIGRINPRKLIVTAGGASETNLLAETCRVAEDGKAVQGEIFTPSMGEVVDASVGYECLDSEVEPRVGSKAELEGVGE